MLIPQPWPWDFFRIRTLLPLPDFGSCVLAPFSLTLGKLLHPNVTNDAQRISVHNDAG